MRITSTQNHRIKNTVKLHQRKYRNRQERMIIEGYRSILRAVDNGYPLQELFLCPPLFFGKNEWALVQRVEDTGAQRFEVTEEIFRKIALRQRSEGLLTIAQQIHRPLRDHQPQNSDFYIIAESIEKPGNLGTVLRSADCAGISGVIVCDPCTDVYHPDVIRASVGAFFSVPVYESSTDEALAWCRRYGIRTLAATPHTDRLYTGADMRSAAAVVVGTEQYGLSQRWLEEADQQIKLPMFGQADSLNVAMSATLLVYEAVRQRNEGSQG